MASSLPIGLHLDLSKDGCQGGGNREGNGINAEGDYLGRGREPACRGVTGNGSEGDKEQNIICYVYMIYVCVRAKM